MGLVSKSLPGFTGGVSQQGAVVRREDQGELCENTIATIVDGLCRRPNSELVAYIDSLDGSNFMVHKINRDLDERYITIFSDDATNPLRIFKQDTGVECAVQYGHLNDEDDLSFTASTPVREYITALVNTPKEDLRAVTVADYTIVVNRTVSPAMYSKTSVNARDNKVYMWIKKGIINTKYQAYLTIDDVLYGSSYTSGDEETDTTEIATGLRSSLNSAGAGVASKSGSLLSFEPTSTTATAKIEVRDGYGNTATVGISNYTVDSIDDLPPDLPATLFDEQLTIKITNGSEADEATFYMKYNTDDGVWEEALAWETEYELNAFTMPHRLVRTDTNTFTFAPIIWGDRIVGDADSSPDPSFIGSYIDDVSFYKNRLCFLSRDNTIMSRAGEYWDFFRQTVMEVLDDDPIDIGNASGQVANLQFAIPFSQGLLMFGDQEQFALTSGDSLMTPETAAIDPTTSYEIDPDCEPGKLGPDVYFVSPKEEYLSLLEYGIQPNSLVQDAADVTKHVPRYVPAGSATIEVSKAMDMVFLHTTGDPTALYVYKFYWNGTEKVQSAWQRWSFAAEILGMACFGSSLSLLLTQEEGFTLEELSLENVPTTLGQSNDFRIHLDSLSYLSDGEYDSDEDETTFDLPFVPADTSDWKLVTADTYVDLTDAATDYTLEYQTMTVTISGDHSARSLYFGRTYESRYRFSEWFIRNSEGVALLEGRLQVRSMTLAFKNTGAFSVEITPFQRDTLTHTCTAAYSGIYIGVTEVGAVNLMTGREKFMVMAKSKNTTIDLVSDSFLPMQIQTGSFEGTYYARSQIL